MATHPRVELNFLMASLLSFARKAPLRVPQKATVVLALLPFAAAALPAAFFAPRTLAAPAPEAALPSGEIAYAHRVLDWPGPHAHAPNPYNAGNHLYCNLYVQRVPGGLPVLIANNRLFPELGRALGSVSFDATGRYVGFLSYDFGAVRRAGTGRTLYVYDLSTRSLQKVKDGIYEFSWSPVGSRILIDGPPSSNDVSLYDCATKSIVPVLTSSSDAFFAQWTNRGQSIFYLKRSQFIERDLRSGREALRWNDTLYAGHDPYASPGSEGFIAYGAVNYGVARPGSRPVGFALPHVDFPEAVWSPDGSLVAFHTFSYFPPNTGGADRPAPTGTDQRISVYSAAAWKPAQIALAWRDDVARPFRYHLIGWSGGGHRWLIVEDDGIYPGRLPENEGVIAYDTQTRRTTRLARIDATVISLDWHGDAPAQ